MKWCAWLLSAVAAGAQGAAEIDRAVQAGIDAGVYPGAVVVIGRSDTILHARGYGRFTWSPKSPVPHPDSSLFDLASLTKVVATLPAVMRLVEQGRLELDRPIRSYLPAFAGDGKDAVTVRHLLAHTSGVRAWLDLPKEVGDSAAARHRVLEEPLVRAPGRRVEYSDLNAMLLGWIVEAVADMPLDRFVEQDVLRPLGMHQTRFKPPRPLHGRTVPNGLWRGTPVAGKVHDQNAAILGGVAGHAGLFSTGLDVARYAQVWLHGVRGERCAGAFRPETISQFSRRAAENRALGWEMRDTTTAENTGSRLSASSFGHTGYTGTSLWIDPEQNLFVVLLTNRVYAPRTGRSITRMKQIRGQVADAAAELAETVAKTEGRVARSPLCEASGRRGGPVERDAGSLAGSVPPHTSRFPSGK